MNPIQAQHFIRSKMYRGASFPIVIHVVTHILDQFRNEVSAYGFVLAAFNRHSAGPVVARVGTDTRQRFTLQTRESITGGA